MRARKPEPAPAASPGAWLHHRTGTPLVVDFRLGDAVQLRKPHPCGGDTWIVVRLGADIGLVCATCKHRILLERVVLERRMKRFIERGLQRDSVSAGVRAAPFSTP